MRAPALAVLAAAASVLRAGAAGAESGYELWLRYAPLEEPARGAAAVAFRSVVVEGQSATEEAVRSELVRGLSALLGRTVEVADRPSAGALVAGTPSSSPLVARLGWTDALRRLGPEGFCIRTAEVGGHPVTVVASEGAVGALYGSFHLLRLLQGGAPPSRIDVEERPRNAMRLLNHWDNLDGSIERGYAGGSLWFGPGAGDRRRLVDYARANASLGINGAVLNNVNADPRVLEGDLLRQAAAVADVLRPYGLRVYLSANVAAPMVLGALRTADPRDPAVARWWRDKAAEIAALVPDFGGFLVKANSEGQPGPQDYGRTHAEGANLLADAVRPIGGVVMWRAFVYEESVDPDRVKRAYREFVPLDGAFRDNVLVQVKNGPLDFQPREPFHPLFGAMPKTPLLAELQVTQEYLGHSTHLVYLAPLWEEFLDADTFAAGPGSTVARVVDGSLHGHGRAGVAGVANTGRDAKWTGHDFAQANWYAFGRLAWDPALSAEGVADEWIRQTWSRAPDVVAALRALMMGSRETLVDYTMPLGLHHLIGGDHYAPMPWNDDAPRRDWTATHYHGADAAGLGYDRTTRGSGAVAQYHPPLRERWNDPRTTPDELLLWFHRLPWDHRLRSGRTLWEELVHRYRRGAAAAARMRASWDALRGAVDEPRHRAVRARLERQARDAAQWAEAAIAYFGRFSGRTAPPPSAR